MRNTTKMITSMLAIAGIIIPLAACGSSSSSSQDGVYLLNFKPEASDEWKKLGEEYTKATGHKVKIQTAASGTYDQTLKSEFTKSEAPTIFQVEGAVSYQTWKAYTADLSESDIYKEMTDQSMALKGDDGQVVGIPYVIESYGIIYNKSILDKYTKLNGAKITSANDIKSFKTLKAVADDMQSRKSELGIKGAFTSAGFDSSSDWRFKTQLAGVPLFYQFKEDNVTQQPATIRNAYLNNLKQVFDLYLTDSTTERTQVSGKTGEDANAEFASGQAAFYQNGTWAWTDMQKSGVKPDNVGMLPIYMGIDDKTQGLVTGSSNYWCINAKASQASQQASQEFLKWVITSDQGKKAFTKDMGFATPFKTFHDMKTDNPLIEIANESLNDKSVQAVSMSAISLMPSENYKNLLGQAMLAYAQGTGDWKAVEDAYVNNWATEYSESHNG